MMDKFQEIKIGDFSALIVPMQELTFREFVPLLEAPDTAKAPVIAAMMRAKLSPEKVEEFDQLTIAEVTELLKQWATI